VTGANMLLQLHEGLLWLVQTPLSHSSLTTQTGCSTPFKSCRRCHPGVATLGTIRDFSPVIFSCLLSIFIISRVVRLVTWKGGSRSRCSCWDRGWEAGSQVHLGCGRSQCLVGVGLRPLFAGCWLVVLNF
jgi:hypothetical protein